VERRILMRVLHVSNEVLNSLFALAKTTLLDVYHYSAIGGFCNIMLRFFDLDRSESPGGGPRTASRGFSTPPGWDGGSVGALALRNVFA
jgi:hypothetical protein